MKIALIGYGKMGHLIHEIANQRGHEVVCIIDPNAQCTMHDAQCTMYDCQRLSEADVAIEFTTPATAADNIRMAWEAGVPVVSGTTGWSPLQLPLKGREWNVESEGNSVKVVDEKEKVWLVWKSNFSVGVNVFFDLNKVLAQALAQYAQYTPSITETHHIHKLDKPSGTAVTLREGIQGAPNPTFPPKGKENGNRQEVPIESIREGEVAGIHTVTWDSEEDTITITHSAKSRRGFALGAVLAAEQLL